jgi:hypothetical protein
MSLMKRSYALPADVLRDFEKAVPQGKRSGMIAEFMRYWLDTRRKARLRKEIVEGCREMAGEYKVIEADFHPLEEEVERGRPR